MVCYQTKSGNANAQRTARASHFVLLDRPEDLGAKLKASYPDIGWAPDTDGHPSLPFSVGCKLILRAGAERDNRDALLFAEFPSAQYLNRIWGIIAPHLDLTADEIFSEVARVAATLPPAVSNDLISSAGDWSDVAGSVDTVAKVNELIDGANGGKVTVTVTETDADQLKTIKVGAGSNDLTISVAGASHVAGTLNTIDSVTALQVTTTEITDISGAADKVALALSSTGLDLNGKDINANVNSGTASLTQINDINGDNGTGTVTATLANTTDLADMVDVVNGLTTGIGDSICAASRCPKASMSRRADHEGCWIRLSSSPSSAAKPSSRAMISGAESTNGT